MRRLLFISIYLLPFILVPTLHAFDIRDVFYNQQVYTSTTGTARGPDTLANIYNPIIQLVYLIGGLFVLFGFIKGGFTIIANSGNAQKVAEGQEIITKTLYGLVALISIYWIVQLVELLTGFQGKLTDPQQLL